MNFKTTVMLLMLLVIASMAYYLMERRGIEVPGLDGDDASDLGTAIFDETRFDADATASIIITSDGDPIELSKSGTGWWQTGPVRFALNGWPVDRMSDTAAELRYIERYQTGGVELSSLEAAQLDPPRAVVTFGFGKETGLSSQTIKLGKKLLGGRAYVMIDDDPHVYVVDDSLHKQILDKKISSLRKTQLDAPEAGKVRRISLKRDGQRIDMVRSDSGWILESPHSGRVDTNAVKDLIGHVDAIYIDGFKSDDPSALSMYGLDAPQTVVAIELSQPVASDPKDGKQSTDDPVVAPTQMHVLRIGASDFKQEKYFATWSDTPDASTVVFAISKSDKENFDKQPDDFRDARITTVARKDMREITLNRSGGDVFKLLYTHGLGTWSFAKPGPGFDANNIESGRLTDAIIAAKAEAYRPDAYPADEPAAIVSVVGINRSEPDVLRIYGVDDSGQRLVLRNHEKTGYLVPADDLRIVFEPVLAFRDRIVLDRSPSNLTALTIKRPDGFMYQFSCVSDEQASNDVDGHEPTPQPCRWKLLGHNRLESQALENLITQLLPLNTTRWYKTAGDMKNPYSIQFGFTDGKSIQYAVDPASRIAREIISDEPPYYGPDVFEVSEKLIESLDAEYRYRTVLEFKADEIVKVTVTRGNRSITVSKDDNDQFASDDEQLIDQAAAAGLFDTLAGLRIQRHLEQLQFEPAQPATKIEIELKGDVTHGIVVAPEVNAVYATAKKAYYSIDKKTQDALLADLVDKTEVDAVK